MLLLDAGVWIASKDSDDPYFESSRALVTDPRQPAAALDLTYYEVANVCGARQGRTEVASELCRTLEARCAGRVVAVDRSLIEAALELAASHGLTAYDAAYVAVAQRNEWRLISTDIADLVSRGLAVAPDAADYP